MSTQGAYRGPQLTDTYVEAYQLSNGEGMDNPIEPMQAYAFEVTSDGQVEYENIYGKVFILPVVAGKIYPVQVKKFISTNTNISGEIIIYKP